MYHLSDIYITEGNKKLPPFRKAHMDSVKTDLYLFSISLNLNCWQCKSILGPIYSFQTSFV